MYDGNLTSIESAAEDQSRYGIEDFNRFKIGK
ncbi:MAG: hypothetical protein ACI9CU_002438 [Polaribacter sp.]|jgi:hypothetical protein